MFATLKVVAGKEADREYRLADEEILLGRGRECGIVIEDVAASRRHARIVLQDGAYVIEDLKSTNRTFVNGTVVAGTRKLKDKDGIRIGGTHFTFKISAPAVVASDEDDSSTVLNAMDASPGTQILFEGDPQAKLQAILKISQALGQALDLDVVLDTILTGLFEIFPHASRALVLLREAERLVPRAVKHRDDDEGSVQYSRTIVARVMQERQAILSQDATHDERFASTQSVVNLRIRSVMCVPLLSSDSEPMGVLQLETQVPGHHFLTGDVQILASVAVQVSVFVQYARLHDEILRQSRLQRELELAEAVQQDFLPQSTPKLEEYHFWAYYLAAGKVGGDYYDFLPLPNGNQAVLLGDVSGKGVPAALRMAKASTTCKVALLSHPDDAGQAAAAMNREICESAARGGFITLVLCVLDPRTHQLTVASAGHPSPLLRRPDGSVADLLHSDGISEAANADGRLYSARRVRKVLAAEKGRPPVETGKALVADVRRHVGEQEQSDDISLVVFGRSPGEQW